MRSEIKSIATIAVGVSLCGVTGYFIYLLMKKNTDDDYNDTIPVTVKQSKLVIKIPKKCVRTVIGRNGFQIREIEKKSDTKICFKEQLAEDDHRICFVRGSKENCALAESLISELIENQPVIETKDIWVPQSSVNRINGRCGERIHYISEISGAKCFVTEIDHSDSIGKRRIILKGTIAQIETARSYIFDIVKEDNEIREKIEKKLALREPRGVLKANKTNQVIMKQSSEKLTTNVAGGDGQMEVYVSAVVDPSQFWLQIVGPKANELDLLVEEMTEYYSKQESQELHVLTEPIIGDIVAAIFMYDGKWYRAEITEIKIENDRPFASLYFLDYGDTDTVPIEEIFELRTDFLRLRFQAIECYLARVRPVNDEWSDEAVDKFEEMTQVAQWKKLKARVTSYKDRDSTRSNDRTKREGSPIPGVDLYDVNNLKDLDIGMELVKCGHALRHEEIRSNNINKMASSTTSISSKSVDENDEHIVNGKNTSDNLSDLEIRTLSSVTQNATEGNKNNESA